MSKKRRIHWQGAKQTNSNDDYWNWVSRSAGVPNEEDYSGFRNGTRPQEPIQANPDVLVDKENSYPSTPQLLMGEAINHLQGRQKEVYLLTMRESKSLAEVGEILGISKGAAQTYQIRAVKFIEQYCKAAIKSGRV